MRRRVLIGTAIGVAVIWGLGFLILASQRGLFGGRAKQLLVQGAHALEQGTLPEAQASLEELVATYPDSPWAAEGLLKLGVVYEAQQQLLDASRIYEMLLARFPDSPLVDRTQARLGDVNVALLFSPIVTDFDTVHEVVVGDTLSKIAKANTTTVELLKRANGLRNDLIRPGKKLKVPKGRFSIVVDKSQNQLLLAEEDQFVKMYPVATGVDNSTPIGTFKIVNKLINPVWYRAGAVVPPDSDENILGTRWMGIDATGYGIHGSIDPGVIGQYATAGCVRMKKDDIEELFAIVPIGTEVTIID